MGWECHWVWRNVCFSYRHFTCPVTPCPPRARLIFGKAATRTGPLCGGFALGRCCPVLVAALPLWAIRGQKISALKLCVTFSNTTSARRRTTELPDTETPLSTRYFSPVRGSTASRSISYWSGQRRFGSVAQPGRRDKSGGRDWSLLPSERQVCPED